MRGGVILISAVKETLREGRPYLATVAGKPTVRTNNERPARKRGRNED